MRGKSSGEKEEERRRKIAEYRRSVAPPRVEEVDPSTRFGGRSHSGREIERIERETGLVFDHWETAGGEFMDREYIGKDRKTSEPMFREMRNSAGMRMDIPVFKKRR